MALAAYTLIPHFMVISVRYLCHYEDALKKKAWKKFFHALKDLNRLFS